MAKKRSGKAADSVGGDPPIDTGNETIDSGNEGGDERASSESGTDFRTYDPSGDAGSNTSGDASGDGKRKRGRPPGAATRSHHKRPTPQENLSGIETTLLSLHAMGAIALSAPELNLDKSEAKLLADAIRNVASHYELSLMTEKQQAWMNLTMVAGGMYSTRIMAIRNNRAAAKPAQPVPVRPIEFPSAASPRKQAAGAAGGSATGYTPSDIFGPDGPTD